MLSQQLIKFPTLTPALGMLNNKACGQRGN